MNEYNKEQNLLKESLDSKKKSEDTSDTESRIHECPKCGLGVANTADICEHCNHWLLKGKCSFCYADVEDGQKFCSECGNPPLGIICQSCNQISHFDFCSKCELPLTSQAEEILDDIKNSIEIQNLLKVTVENNSNSNEKNSHSNNEIKKLSDYLSISNNKKKKNSFIINDKNKVNVEANLKNIEQSKNQIESENINIKLRQEIENQALKLLEDIRNKKFANNQEARRFFGALKIFLPELVKKRIPTGWKCNAYSAVHKNPQECACPSAGGTWLYNIADEEDFKEVEI
jgi:hypothetical protein